MFTTWFLHVSETVEGLCSYFTKEKLMSAHVANDSGFFFK